MSERRFVRVASWLAIALAAAGPAVGDILVTQDGGRVETKGPWQVRGSMVVFNLPNGTLSSIRASEVDLEASRLATEEALKPPPAPPPPPPKKAPIAVITTEDVGRAETSSEEPTAETQGEGGATPTGGTPKGAVATDLDVTGWKVEDRPGFSGVFITGSVRNTSPLTMSDLSISATLLDDRGKPGRTFKGFVNTRVLFAQAIATFEIPLQGVHDVYGAEIAASGVSVKLGVAGSTSSSAEDSSVQEGEASSGTGSGDAEPADTGGG